MREISALVSILLVAAIVVVSAGVFFISHPTKQAVVAMSVKVVR